MALATRPKPNAQHKKRQGSHHKHTSHYAKTYWPYLPMLGIVLIGLAVSNFWTTRTRAVLGRSSDFAYESLLDATNGNRVAHDEVGLQLNDQLNAAAQAKAEDMASQDYWAHNSPSGKTPWDFITAAGYNYQAAGENLAYGFDSASTTVSGWMSSPEHRDNILNANYTDVGFGVAEAKNFQGQGSTVIVVAEYGTPTSAVANITFKVDNPAHATLPASTTRNTEIPTQPVARVQLLNGGMASWSLVAVAAIAASALTLFIVRHGLRIRRLVSRGEAFVARHLLLDTAMVAVVMICFVLSRSSGFIR